MNPRWEDLAREWQNVYTPETGSRGDPSLRLKNGFARDDAGPVHP